MPTQLKSPLPAFISNVSNCALHSLRQESALELRKATIHNKCVGELAKLLRLLSTCSDIKQARVLQSCGQKFSNCHAVRCI
jgi:hypothetical protein